jgi:ferredoxin
MGSGGMVVMDEDNCMVDVAKYFVDFLRNESCGKCTPCREGLPTLSKILTDITEGRGKEGDVELLQEICETLKDTALCGLGQTAPNPVLSTIRYFRDEYEAHIKEKRCPARVCRELIQYYIDEEKCVKDGRGCDVCRKNCPENAISGELNRAHTINPELCTKCGLCFELCRFNAIKIE